MGLNDPFEFLGVNLGDRELLVNPEEAEQVRQIFTLYLEKGSVRALKSALDRWGMRSKVRHQKDGRITGGGPFSRGHLYRLLANPRLPARTAEALLSAMDEAEARRLAAESGDLERVAGARLKHQILLARRCARGAAVCRFAVDLHRDPP